MVSSGNNTKESPSQTAGPYVHIGCMPRTCEASCGKRQDLGATMISNATLGERITIVGHIFDGAGEPLKDAMIEIWQADHLGSYRDDFVTQGMSANGTADPFTGWGRQATSFENGLYRFETIKPGQVPFPDGKMQAPHITFWIVARGLNIGLHTRMYFPDEPANATCPVLSLTDQERRHTLIATRNGNTCTFEIFLQGDKETIFFDI